MSIIENFLVNTSNFETIIHTLVNDNNIPEQVTDTYFKSLGFENPSDFLVIHLLKGLNFLDENAKTTDRFNELKNPNSLRIAMAKAIVPAYEDLFEKYPNAHKMQGDDLVEAFSDIFQGKKTKLIIKYMSNTFTQLVSYAGVMNVEKVMSEVEAQIETSSERVNHVPPHHKNGNSEPSEQGNKRNKEKNNFSYEDLVNQSSNKPKNTKSRAGLTELGTPSEKNSQDTPPAPDEGVNGAANSKKILPRNAAKTETEDIFEALGSEITDSDIPADANKDERQSNHNVENKPKLDVKKVRKALIKKADILYKLGRHKEALPALDDIITYFEQSGDQFLKDAVNLAVIRRATILYKLQKYDRALPALDKVITRFSQSDNAEFYKQASMAMLYKAQILESTGQLDQAMPLFNSIIDRLGDSSNPQIKKQVDRIHLKRMDLLFTCDNDEEVLMAANQLIERFKDSEENLHLLEEVMFKKAEILEEMNHKEEALQAYSEFLKIFGNYESVN